MVSLCNVHYSAIYDKFRPYKCCCGCWWNLWEDYTLGVWRGDEISSYIILWGSRLLILHMIYGYHVEHCYLRNCRLKCRVIQGKKLGSVYSKNVPRMPIPFPQEIYFTVASHLTRNNGDFSLILIMKLDSLAWV